MAETTRRTVRRKKVDTAEEVRAKADELHANGMPFQMAMAVAHGNMGLSEALERMERKERVGRLMEEHDLSRALATQVAMGHVALEVVLRKRRLQEHRDENRDRTALVVGSRVALGLHGKKVSTGTITADTPYSVTFQPEKGEAEEIHKLQIKYAYAPDDWKRVKKALKTDKAVAKEPREPIVRPQDRYSCSDKRLYRHVDKADEVSATLLEGTQVRGQVLWFSRYEMGMRLRGDVEIVVFRHALHDLR